MKISVLIPVFKLSVGFITALLFLAGCNLTPEKEKEITVYHLTGLEIRPFEINANGFVYTDTLRNIVAFHILTEQKESIIIESASMKTVMLTDISVIPFQNPTVFEHAALIFNKPVMYKDQVIEADSNLLDHPALAQSSPHYIPGEFLFTYELVPFLGNFVLLNMDVFHFEPGDYEILFQWGTEEGEFFQDTVTVYIDPCTESCPDVEFPLF